MAKEDLFQKYAECNPELPKRVQNIAGVRSGALVAIKYVGNATEYGGDAMWLCQCDCGQLVLKRSYLIKRGTAMKCENIESHVGPFADQSADIFKQHISVTDSGCWEWIRRKNKRGYGQLDTRVDGKPTSMLAHRVSFKLFVGPLKDEDCVLHRCDNPPCCNPDHLYVGDRKQNLQDMMLRRRRIYAVTEEQVIEIKRLLVAGVAQKEIANIMGTTRAVVGFIKTGRTWKHVPWPE